MRQIVFNPIFGECWGILILFLGEVRVVIVSVIVAVTVIIAVVVIGGINTGSSGDFGSITVAIIIIIVIVADFIAIFAVIGNFVGKREYGSHFSLVCRAQFIKLL